MSAGVIVDTTADLTSRDMTGITEGFLKVVEYGYGDFIYDSTYSGTFNAPFIIEHTGGGGGAWLASGIITLNGVAPTGIAELPIMVNVKTPGSVTGFSIFDVYVNGGGGNNIWNREGFS